MRPVLIPIAEHLGRIALRRLGIPSAHVPTAFGPLHTYDGRGKGTLPTTVLLHGIASAATPFGPLFAHLHRHVRRIVAPDYPGHGFSADDTERLTPRRLYERVSGVLDTKLDEPAIVIGNSLGGALAMRYAFERPERVRALVLLSPAGARSTEEEWLALKTAFDLTSRAHATVFAQRLYHRTPWFVPFVAHEITASMHRRAVRDILATASNDDMLTESELATLKMPILFFWGRSERLLPAAHLDYFRRNLPGHAVFETPEGFGHCPHFDDVGRLARRIVDFAHASARPST